MSAFASSIGRRTTRPSTRRWVIGSNQPGCDCREPKMPLGSEPWAVAPAFCGKILEYSSQSIAIEMAWRSARFLTSCSGVAP